MFDISGNYLICYSMISQVEKNKRLTNLLCKAQDSSKLLETPNLNRAGIGWTIVNNNFHNILPHCEAGMSATRFAHFISSKLFDPLGVGPRENGHIPVPKNFNRTEYVKKIVENLPIFSPKPHSVIHICHGFPLTPRKSQGAQAVKIITAQGISWAELTPKEEFVLQMITNMDIQSIDNHHYSDGPDLFEYLWSNLPDKQRQLQWQHPEIVLPSKQYDKYGVRLSNLDPNGVTSEFVLHAARLRASETFKATWDSLLLKNQDQAKYIAAKIITVCPTKDMPKIFYQEALKNLGRVTANPALQALGALDCYRNKAIDITELIDYGSRIKPDQQGKHAQRALAQIGIETCKHGLIPTNSNTTEMDIF